jgi:hypothetical protein
VLGESFSMSSTAPTHIPAGASTTPDWENISHDVKCPLCDYNLRGLSDPRCPECGYRFEWAAVLDPANRLHPYLFEHHPEKSVRAYLQTLIHHLLPGKFWTTLTPTHRLRPQRILLYWAIYAIVTFIPAVVALIASLRYYSGLRSGAQGWYWTNSPDTLTQIAISREGFAIETATLLLALYPWFSFLALMIFQQSMRRARIKPSHVLRCAIYSGDVILWYSLAATMAILWLPRIPRVPQTEQLALLLAGGALLAGLLNAARLWVAYKRYMKFKRALAVVFASQFIVALTLFAIVIYLPE